MPDELTALRMEIARKDAVLARIRHYFEVMRTDARMKTMAEIVLREIERIEKEEGERGR